MSIYCLLSFPIFIGFLFNHGGTNKLKLLINAADIFLNLWRRFKFLSRNNWIFIECLSWESQIFFLSFFRKVLIKRAFSVICLIIMHFTFYFYNLLLKITVEFRKFVQSLLFFFKLWFVNSIKLLERGNFLCKRVFLFF